MIDFNYQADYQLNNESVYTQWLHDIARSEQVSISELSYVFCTDDYLLHINQQFLNHDTWTDIITFDYSNNDMIKGEIYISIDRVADNALQYQVTTHEELLRVMAHGLLHLCGYVDKTDQDQQQMRSKEDEKIKMFHVKQ